MTSAVQLVLEESERFYEALPDLITTHAGRWVVFKGGEVVSDHDTEEEAYADGVERFGVDGGQVVAQVETAEPVPATMAVLFG